MDWKTLLACITGSVEKNGSHEMDPPLGGLALMSHNLEAPASRSSRTGKG